MKNTQANKTWSANDGQCLAINCANTRGYADPYCAAHRYFINRGEQRPIPKPPTIPTEWPWNPPRLKISE